MERRKVFISIFVSLLLVMITINIYRFSEKRAEANNFKQAKTFVESYGWKPGFWATVNTTIDENAHIDYEIYRYRQIASQDIGLNYLEQKDKKVELFAFNINKEYQNKPIFAHALVYRGKVIGAYLQSQTDNVNEVYVFSMRDSGFQHPNMK